MAALLREGTFSQTFVATDGDGSLINLKICNATNARQSHSLQFEHQAMQALMRRPHQHIHGILGITRHSETSISFVLEPTSRMTELGSLLAQDGPWPAPAVRAMMVQMCHALGHLHSLDIIHRDLTPDSVLVDSTRRIRITSFDSACPRATATSLIGTVRYPAPSSAAQHLFATHFACAAIRRLVSRLSRSQPEFMAPEVVIGATYTKAVDWWALGAVACETLTGHTPFYVGEEMGVEDLVRRIIHSEIRVPVHAHAGHREVAFILALLTRDPTQRLGAELQDHEAVLAHEWFHEMLEMEMP